MKKLQDMTQGFLLFKKELMKEYGKKKIYGLYQKQKPKTLVISCSDSRVDPAILLNMKLGEIFVVRNVGNIIPPFQKDHSTYHGTSAAIEFAVQILKVKNILIIGHSGCGAIKTLLEHNESEESQFEYILDWVFILKNVKKQLIHQENLTKEEIQDQCSQLSIKHSINNLKSFPFIEEKLSSKKLNIYGLFFAIHDMSLHSYNEDKDQFEKLY